MRAQVDSRWDTGEAQSFRDENDGLWRIAVDAGDGTLAVEEILDGGDPMNSETVGDRPCGIASWERNGDGIDITACSSHGENHTDGTVYEGVYEKWEATPNGWLEMSATEEPEGSYETVCVREDREYDAQEEVDLDYEN